jgi:hypothetical protein
MIPKDILDQIEIKETANSSATVRYKPKPCADCGQIANNRVVSINAAQRGNKNYWRFKCSHCKLSSLDGVNWQNSSQIEAEMRGSK